MTTSSIPRAAAAEPPADRWSRFRGAWRRRLPWRVQRPGWLLAFLCGVVLLIAAAVVEATGVASARAFRLGYGVVATALMLGALALAGRRRVQARGPGRVQDWVQLHVYGGTLFLGAVGLHAGWGWPSGTLDRWLLVASTLVVVTGLAGVALRRTIPVLLTRGLESEVLYERIPEHAEELRQRTEKVVEGASEAIRSYYRTSMADEMAAPRASWRYFFDVSGSTERHRPKLDMLERISDEAGREALRELRGLLRAKRELDVHLTLQRPLRWWLAVHVPLSWLLVALVGVHLFSVATY